MSIMFMKQWLLMVVLVFAGTSAPAFAQPVKIGFIDGVRIENETRRAFDISEMLRKEFSAREQEMKAQESRVKTMQTQVAGITDARERELKQREFQTLAQRFDQSARAFLDDLERRKAEERRKYYVDVTAIVTKIAEAGKFDVIVQEAVYSSKAIDLTEQVIKALGGPAPKPAGK
ncbi:MAG TPA: OmpH family outer membrane protein [Burkholderiales bacterium]|nr:OmpH family outer membrane protein [Burkholderiales bacterium]